MTSYRYSRWDGTQEVFPLHEDEVMEQLSEQFMAHGDVSSALRTLVQRGASGRSGRNLPGVEELLQKLCALRQETLNQYDLDSVVGEIERRLQDVIDTERRGGQRRVDEVQARLEDTQSNGGAVSPDMAEGLLDLLEKQAALHIVGFSTYAREVKPEVLPYLSLDEFDPYTNIQHGLEVSQRLLSRLSGGSRQIIMISVTSHRVV